MTQKAEYCVDQCVIQYQYLMLSVVGGYVSEWVCACVYVLILMDATTLRDILSPNEAKLYWQ